MAERVWLGITKMIISTSPPVQSTSPVHSESSPVIVDDSLNLSNAEVARNLNVDPSTVWRTVKMFEETGTVM